jgi:predicted nucleic acid-binding protein
LRLYIDSNIFVYAFECETDLGHAARPAFILLDEKKAIGVASQFVLAEVLPRPLRDNDVKLEHAYETTFAGRAGLEVYPMTLSVLRLSAKLVAYSKLRSADAIHAATAVTAACDAFLTEDRGLRLPPGIRPLTLSDETFT